MEYHNAVKHLVFIVTILFYSVASAPLTTSLPSQASTPQEKPCRSLSLSLGDSTLLLPRCDQQGYFKALQINEKRIRCVTADLGWENDTISHSELGPCKALKKCVEETPGSSDQNLISCDELGFFEFLQRTDTGKICVNSYGIITKEMNVTKKSDCRAINIANEENYNKDLYTSIQKGDTKTY